MRRPPAKVPATLWGAPLAVLALAALGTAAAPSSAQAALPGSAGNTVVRNTITVNYKDATGTAQTPVTSTVDITVTTVAATPAVVSFTPSPGSTDGTGATQGYTVRVRTNSNGPGTVSFGTADGPFTNVGSGTSPTVPASIFLGATVIDPSDLKVGVAQPSLANGASITFAVPNDGGVSTDSAATGGATGDGIINGIKVGDIVYLSDGVTSPPYGPFSVTAVSDPAVGVGTTAAPGSITMTNNGNATGAFTPQVGWQIVEGKDVTVTVTQGIVPILTAQNNSSWVTTVTATMGGTSGTGTVTTNAHAGKLSVTKYVRNVTAPVAGSGAYTPPVTLNGASNTFYTSGVGGKPGDVLEYLAVVSDIGTGNSTGVNASDIIPTYATLVTNNGAYGVGGGSGAATDTFAHARFGTETDLKVLITNNGASNVNVAYGGAAGTTAGSAMTFYLGTACSTVLGGGLTPGQTEYLIYQVKIN